MLISLALLATAFVWGSQAANRPPLREQAPLTRSFDDYAAGRCMGSMVGFRNVRVDCVTDAQGRPAQCRVDSENPRVLRYQRVFDCMAGTVTYTEADGSPAVGEQVRITFNGNSWFTQERRAADRPWWTE